MSDRSRSRSPRKSPARKGSRSPSPKKGSRSRSPAKKASRSRSPAKKGSLSRSPARKGSRSPARKGSRSRSPARKGSRSRSAKKSPKRSRSRSRKRRSRSRSRDRKRGADVEPTKLYIGNLSFRTRERDLDDAFGKFGPISDIFIPQDGSGRPRGFAFVTFEDERDAEDAVEDMDDRDFMERRIRCNIARARQGGPPPRDFGYKSYSSSSKEPCRDFERGNCNRGSSCRYDHGRSRSRSRDRKRSRSRSRSRDRR